MTRNILVFQKFENPNYIRLSRKYIYLYLQPTAKISMIRRTVYFAIPLHGKQLAWKFVNLEAVMREKVICSRNVC